MNSKRFIRLSLCLTLVLLLLVGTMQVMIDPLFQYHYPWFGLEPVITDERYQDAGIVRNFEFDNVIMGNSLAENFKSSDVSRAFGGKTVKLTASGSHTLDWTYLLDVIKNSQKKPKNVLIHLDPNIFHASYTELKHDMPTYLYDECFTNDVNYLFNFSIIEKFTINTIESNCTNEIPDYNTFMIADEFQFSKDFVLEHYSRPEVNTNDCIVEMPSMRVVNNLSLIVPYLETMPETQFVFFFSPFSMLYWDTVTRDNSVAQSKAEYNTACEILSKYNNVTLYLWTDDEMLHVMSNLDNYVDEMHYSPDICVMMADRIRKREGIISKATYEKEIDKLFNYIETFDYESLFE